MDDLTSKRALLEKIADLFPYCGHCDGYGFVQLDCVEDAVKEAPTIDQPRWIPVAERLPQEDEPLGKLCEIVQVLLKDGTVTVGFCNRSLQAWVHLPIADTYFVGRSYATTPVIAWMPLAQPPKGDE